MKRQLKLQNEATLEIACQMPVSSASQEEKLRPFCRNGRSFYILIFVYDERKS